jgi:hypothetical protein
MKYAWLDKLAEQGLIRPAVLDSIYADVNQTVKEGAVGSQARELFERALNMGVMVGTGAVASMVGRHLGEKKHLQQGMAKIVASRSAIASDPEFQGSEDKAQARFDEIALYAPHVAMNTPLAKRVVKSKLNEGLSDSDVQALALLQAQYFPNALQTDKFQQKAASISQEKMGEMLADIYLLKTAATDFSKMTKVRGSMPFLGRLGRYAQHVGMYASIPLVVGAAAGAANVALRKHDQKSLEKNLEAAFSKAMSLSDKDKEPLHANKEKARQAFSALAHFAPHVALEPQAARAFMTKIVAYDQGMNISDIKDLAEIQNNISKNQKDGPFRSGFLAAGAGLGTSKIVQRSMEEAGFDFGVEGKEEFEDPGGKVHYR